MALQSTSVVFDNLQRGISGLRVGVYVDRIRKYVILNDYEEGNEISVTNSLGAGNLEKNVESALQIDLSEYEVFQINRYVPGPENWRTFQEVKYDKSGNPIWGPVADDKTAELNSLF